jgi:hypothetical protein
LRCVWTNLRGAFAGIQASLTDITFDSGYNEAVYGSKNIHRILADQTTAPKLAMDLRKMMPPGAPSGATHAAVQTKKRAG